MIFQLKPKPKPERNRKWNYKDIFNETLSDTRKKPYRNPFERLEFLIRNPDKRPYMKPEKPSMKLRKKSNPEETLHETLNETVRKL
jgi:hypothetical protein